jgi:hypothetical protein
MQTYFVRGADQFRTSYWMIGIVLQTGSTSYRTTPCASRCKPSENWRTQNLIDTRRLMIFAYMLHNDPQPAKRRRALPESNPPRIAGWRLINTVVKGARFGWFPFSI